MKKIRKMGWKIFFALFEKKYHFNNHTLKYLFVNNHTKNLCVVFSAFPDKDAMPGYNLVRTLVPNNRNFSYLFCWMIWLIFLEAEAITLGVKVTIMESN